MLNNGNFILFFVGELSNIEGLLFYLSLDEDTIGFVTVLIQFSNALISTSAIENLLSSIIIKIFRILL